MRLPIQVEAIIFRRKGSIVEYLLLKRLPERNGFWQPVTGGVEEGENLEEALRREIEEETGVKGFISIMEGIHYYEFADPVPNREYAFGVEVSPNEKVTLDGKEHSEYCWCDLQEALRLLHWEENKEAFKKLDDYLRKE